MRNLILVVCLLVFCITFAAAQGKISTEWKCDGNPPDQHSIKVPDGSGQSYNIAQGKCTAEKGSIGGAKEQEGTYTEFIDAGATSAENHGVFVDTVAGGDKLYYHYHGSQTFKDGKFVSGSNKWTLHGGTGKFKDAKGEGGCKGKGNPDNSSNWDCEGAYTGVK